MALSTAEFLARLASDEKHLPHKEPRVDSVPFPDDSYFEALGKEVEKHPIGLPRRILRRPTQCEE